MSIDKRRLRRWGYGFAAVVVSAITLAPVLSQEALAAGQVTARSIQMSNSLISSTNVSYKVTFNPATTATVQAIIVDFCDNDPLVDDTTCSLPGGFSITASPAVSGQSAGANCNLSTFTTVGQLNSNRTLELSAASAVSINSSGVCSFTLTTVTNPNTINHSFYARIYTYDTKAHADSYSPGVLTNVIDAGGVALSTSRVINITAKVMEQLAFCVYDTACGDDPSFTIGHAVGTATIIDSSAVDTSTSKFSISTNAQSGAGIRLKGDTLKSGANSIHPAGSSAITFAIGTENFGVRVSTAGTNITATAPYDGGSGTQYGLDNSSAGTSDITTLYGGALATLTAPANASVTTMTWAAAASNTTKAGTYTAAEQLIATGTF